MAEPRPSRLPTADELAAAQAVVAAHLSPTPLVAAPELGTDVWLKLETTQPTGAFKVRGALAALSALPAGERAVTPSAGNHGLGMAWAARRLHRDVTIVVARTASPAKVAALRELGADLVEHGASYDEAEAHALSLPGTFVSGYNDPHVIAGQATIGPEIDAAALTPRPPGHESSDRRRGDDLSTAAAAGGAVPVCVVTPAGGGGLASGLCAWASARGDARVVAVEADRSRALSAAAAAGEVVVVDVGDTLADGLAGNLEAGSATVAGTTGATFAAVTEADLRAAMRALAARHGLVVEGAAAVAYAAVATRAVRPGPGERTVVVLTGRNVALPVLAEVLAGD